MGTTELADARYVSITTFKRDGTPVSTPVWVAADDGTLLVHSEANSWKVKRIRERRARREEAAAFRRELGRTFVDPTTSIAARAFVEQSKMC